MHRCPRLATCTSHIHLARPHKRLYPARRVSHARRHTYVPRASQSVGTVTWTRLVEQLPMRGVHASTISQYISHPICARCEIHNLTSSLYTCISARRHEFVDVHDQLLATCMRYDAGFAVPVLMSRCGMDGMDSDCVDIVCSFPGIRRYLHAVCSRGVDARG